MGRHVEVEPAAQDVLAQEAARISLLNSPVHDFDQVSILAANVDVALLGGDRQAGNQHPFNDAVRVVLHQQAVFAGARFAFVGVANHILQLGRLARHEAPLHPRREARAAPAAQSRFLHLVHNGLRRHLDSLAQGLVALVRQVGLERGRIRQLEPLTDHLNF